MYKCHQQHSPTASLDCTVIWCVRTTLTAQQDNGRWGKLSNRHWIHSLNPVQRQCIQEAKQQKENAHHVAVSRDGHTVKVQILTENERAVIFLLLHTLSFPYTQMQEGWGDQNHTGTQRWESPFHSDLLLRLAVGHGDSHAAGDYEAMAAVRSFPFSQPFWQLQRESTWFNREGHWWDSLPCVTEAPLPFPDPARATPFGSGQVRMDREQRRRINRTGSEIVSRQVSWEKALQTMSRTVHTLLITTKKRKGIGCVRFFYGSLWHDQTAYHFFLSMSAFYNDYGFGHPDAESVDTHLQVGWQRQFQRPVSHVRAMTMDCWSWQFHSCVHAKELKTWTQTDSWTQALQVSLFTAAPSACQQRSG